MAPPIAWTLGDRGDYDNDFPNLPSLPPGAIAIHYPMPKGTIRSLRVRVPANSFNQPTTFTVYKNNVATGLSVTVPAAATGDFSDLVNTVAFAPDDLLDLIAAAPGLSALGALGVSSTLEFAR